MAPAAEDELPTRLFRLWREWADRRCVRSDTVLLTRKNVFILPTGAGLAYVGLLILLLLTAINYQNSLVYVVTFLLAMLFFLSIVQTFSALAGLQLTLVRAGEGFAGSGTNLVIRLHAEPGQNYPGLRVLGGGLRYPLALGVPAGETRDCSIPYALERRGAVTLPRIRVESRFPFGLFSAWSWFRPASTGLAWPRPLLPPPGLVAADGNQSGNGRPRQGEEWLELRPYRRGDPLQRVQWKRFGRTGEMVSAQWHAPDEDPTWIDFERFQGYSREQRLGFMTALVEMRHQESALYGLRLPGREIPPATGVRHRLVCLREMATFQSATAACQENSKKTQRRQQMS